MKTASDVDGAEAEREADWMPFIVFIQNKGGLRWDEILAAPLLRLNSIHAELVKIVSNDIAGSMSAGMMGALGGSPAVESDKKKNAIFGETPQFQSRDEYFKWVDQHRGG